MSRLSLLAAVIDIEASWTQLRLLCRMVPNKSSHV